VVGTTDNEREDEDGKRFKLSDFRGNVVLLEFWSFV
jgi:cytochrome oxidase Cu insertion factor (SCO1/SenC/PrrC family)